MMKRQYGETTNGLSAYLHDLLLYPLLSPTEVVTLIRRAQRDDITARNRVVEANLRLVVYAAKGYARSGLPLLDLIQAGNEGLLHAVQKFDAQRGVSFPCYALFWIRQRIQGIDTYAGKSSRGKNRGVNTLGEAL
jgi:DNA-directed RNA polymerase sigma subunit (sigma70/sigma32)